MAPEKLEIAPEKLNDLAALVNEAKVYLSFTQNDVKRLNMIAPKIKPHIPKIVSYVVKAIGINKKLVDILENYPLPIETAVTVFEKWLENVLSWNYDDDFAKQAYRIGAAHANVGINSKIMTLTMGNFMVGTSFVVDKMIADKNTTRVFLISIQKAFMLNLTLMLQYYDDIKTEKTLNKLYDAIKR